MEGNLGYIISSIYPELQSKTVSKRNKTHENPSHTPIIQLSKGRDRLVRSESFLAI